MRRLKAIEQHCGNNTLYLVHRAPSMKPGVDKAIYMAFSGHKKLTGWDVVYIIAQKEVEIFGNMVAAHERLPSAEQYGTYGWFFQPVEHERAMRKYLGL